jgi:hypothetical protein
MLPVLWMDALSWCKGRPVQWELAQFSLRVEQGRE